MSALGGILKVNDGGYNRKMEDNLMSLVGASFDTPSAVSRT
jgi:hypothetical protein